METKTCKVCGREKGLNDFYRNRIGYTLVCKDCVSNKRKTTKDNKNETVKLRALLSEKRQLALNDFTPRELMLELRRRGYEGNLTYTEVHTINIANL